jgi:hypothetical protein
LNYWNDFSVQLNYTCFLSPGYYVFYDLPKKLCSDCYRSNFMGANILPFSVWSHVTRIQVQQFKIDIFSNLLECFFSTIKLHVFLIAWLFYIPWIPRNYAQIVTSQAFWVQISCPFQFELMLLWFSANVIFLSPPFCFVVVMVE